ncbi:MAG TPA: efflux RND transporter periplasmic adaptor subunit [Bryobacteraceae bacterium]|jgi:multidrug efflux system membrane fusion protein|nr:efflux RND transporter periplasmic adaptor subunit [Bryobacteraceae bacterium]
MSEPIEQTNRTLVEEKSRQVTQPKRRAWLAAVLVLLITAALLVPLWLRQKQGPAAPGFAGPGGPPGAGLGGPNAATPIETATVQTEPMSVFIDAIGTVTPERTASIYSQVSGQLLAVNYTEGQIVKQGQSLIEVDPRPYQALLDQARGALARDRSLLHQAQVNAKRYEDALKRNAIAQQTLFDQQATVEQYQGTIQNDEGSVKYYEVQLGYCHIVAPFTGRIGLRLVDPGNTIFSGASNTLAVITQLDPITVVFSIPEDDVQRVQNQLRRAHTMKVNLFDRAQNHEIAAGSLLAFDNQIDTTTGTVKFRARFRNPNGSLFPNQFVNARLLVDTLPAAQVLPTSVIQYNGQQAFVYVVDRASNTVHLQNVTVTNEANDESAVQGLAQGTLVASSNFDRLQDGAKVMLAGRGTPPFGPGGSGPGGPPAAGGKPAGPGEPPPTNRKPGNLTGASR